ncbi:MAG: methyl-accepting chemotaxis protein [Nitrospirae bacterium]|nr:methyl-accepting chemotaxis protein [Nitrospirota bacterium]MCL5422888.1 methyl-accepting chemotaxis protein [Nitrospirota bacterium]
MFLKRIKISHKVSFVIILSLVVFIAFTIGTIMMGKKQLDTLEEIYAQKVAPLDNLRKIQLTFRELEYRMAGVTANIVAAIGSGEHLKISLNEIDRLWNEVKGRITDDALLKDKENFEKGYSGFRKVAGKLQSVYFNDDPKSVPGLIDEYFDFRPLLFKSIDKMAEAQEKAVIAYYTEKQQIVAKINRSVVIMSIFLIAIFLFFGITINRSITRPINDTVVVLKDIAEGKGDLTRRLTVTSEDEIGTLARWFNKFIEGMQNMVKGLLEVSREVSSASNAIGRSSRLVHDSAKTQMEAIETTSASTEEMSASIKAVAADIEELNRFTENASSSSLEMSAVVTEIANHAEELDALTDRTASSINQIAVSLKEVASGVETLFRETEDIAATMTEMSKSINEVSTYSKEQAVMSARVKENASVLGLEAVKITRGGIEKIREEVFSTAKIVGKLGEMSIEIGKIVEVIDGISDTTNLLSLNAAILAAQAGEHGKGFAVVADEVKGLAERTAVSTKEIEELIKKIQEMVAEAESSTGRGLERVATAEKLSKDAENALTTIVESSETSLEMAKRIELAIDEQTRGVGQVAANIQRVNVMTEGIKRATEEQNTASENILLSTENVRTLTQMVKKSTAEQSVESKALSKVIADASQRMKTITHATAEQRNAVGSILKAIETLMEESEKNVRLATDLDRMVQNLETQGTSLDKQVASFQV